jgi:hypothetical protein
MKQSARFFMGLLVAAFMWAGVSANPAMAQGKAAKAEKGKAAMTTLAENDKARAFEVRYKAGDQNTAVPTSSYRVVRALKSGTLLRTYADGKTEKVQWKAGEVKIIAPDLGQYTTKNVGKSELVLYVVVLK